MSDKKFEEELKKAYKVGEKILNNPRFKRISELHQNSEKKKEPND